MILRGYYFFQIRIKNLRGFYVLVYKKINLTIGELKVLARARQMAMKTCLSNNYKKIFTTPSILTTTLKPMHLSFLKSKLRCSPIQRSTGTFVRTLAPEAKRKSTLEAKKKYFCRPKPKSMPLSIMAKMDHWQKILCVNDMLKKLPNNVKKKSWGFLIQKQITAYPKTTNVKRFQVSSMKNKSKIKRW